MDILDEISELKIDWKKQPKEEIHVEDPDPYDTKSTIQLSKDLQDFTALSMRTYRVLEGQSQKQLKVRRMIEQFADLCYRVLDPRVTNALTFKYCKQKMIAKLK